MLKINKAYLSPLSRSMNKLLVNSLSDCLVSFDINLIINQYLKFVIRCMCQASTRPRGVLFTTFYSPFQPKKKRISILPSHQPYNTLMHTNRPFNLWIWLEFDFLKQIRFINLPYKIVFLKIYKKKKYCNVQSLDSKLVHIIF